MNTKRMHGFAGTIVAIILLLAGIPAIAAMMKPPSISIVSPAPGATVRGAAIPLSVAISNFRLECANVGKTNAPMGEGHIHVMVDGLDMAHLISPYCTKNISFSGQGLSAGKHMLTVALANDAHVISSLPVTIPFTYVPSGSNALPGSMAGGKPSVRILSPKNGASVAKRFNLILAVSHFDLSCNLEGKRDVAGWGHIHVFVQQAGETSASPRTPMIALMKTPQGMKMGQQLMKQTGMTIDQLKPMLMMGEAGMIGMPCTKTIPVDLSTWHSGAAQILVMLANNDHMPAAGAAPSSISVKLK